HFVCGLLIDAGIDASVTEDVSMVGGWVGGLIPEIHKPQVWIERADISRAAPVIAEYERRSHERRASEAVNSESAAGTIDVTCDECGKPSSFPLAQKGSVQNCPHCHAYVDVGDDSDAGEWHEDGEG